MTKLVIFDLDGTLLNTIDDLAHSANHILAQYGYPQHEVNAYKYFVGNGISTLLDRALPNEILPSMKKRVFDDFLAYYQEHKVDMTAPYPGIIDLLETLQNKGIAVAIATNKAQAAIPGLMTQYFPTINFVATLGDREGKPLKPDPTVVEDIIEITKIDKTEILYLGDTAVDMQTANRANVTSVGVLWGFREREELEGANAMHIIEHPLDLLELL